MSNKENERQLLEFLKKHNGLPENTTWTAIGLRFGLRPDNPKRDDELYFREYARKRAKYLWDSYLAKGEILKVAKQVYRGNEPVMTTLRRESTIDPPPVEDYEVESFTTVPYSDKAYIRYRKDIPKLTKEWLEDLKNILAQEIDSKPVFTPSESTSPYNMAVYMSDKHIGAYTEKNSLYENDYSRPEMYRRLVEAPLKLILDTVKKYGPIKNLLIFDLGDAMDGFNKKTTRGLNGKSGHTLPQSLNNREQFETYLALHKEFFDRLLDMGVAERVFFLGAGNNNHGGDFDYIVMKALEIYLNLRYPNVVTHVSDKLLDHIVVENDAIIYSHGNDSEDKIKGFPINLDQRTESFLNSYIDIYNLHGKRLTIVSGDMHTFSLNRTRKFRYLKVLSQYGASKWMQYNFYDSLAGINFDLFFSDRVVTGEITFDISKPKIDRPRYFD